MRTLSEHGGIRKRLNGRQVDAEEALPVGVEQRSVVAGRKRRVWQRPMAWVLAAVAGVGVAGAGTYYVQAQGWESTDDAFVEGHIVQVSPRVAGHVARVLVDDNQAVKAGDVLVELDARDYQARLEEAQAALASAEGKAQAARAAYEQVRVTAGAEVQQARAGVQEAEAEVVAARAAVDATKAEQVRAASELERIAPLEGTGAASKQDVTAKRSAAQAADAQVVAAQKRVAAAEAAVAQAKAKFAAADVAPQRVAEAKAAEDTAVAEVARAKAAVEAARLDLSYTRVVAQQDGRVTRKTVEAGQWVQAGQAMFALVPADVWVTANFKETQLTHMRPGQAVEIGVDAYPGVKFEGHVDSIQMGSGARFSLLPPENATGNYVKVVQRVPVKIVFDGKVDSRYVIGPGMSVEPEVRVGE
jgi:membrane fusion protein (multidrug efflux system)